MSSDPFPTVYRPFPGERWESVTPPELTEAVQSIRRNGDDNFWRAENVLEKIEDIWKTLYGRACFGRCYEKRLLAAKRDAKRIFEAFRPIGIANRHILSMSPTHWSYGQTHAVLAKHFGANHCVQKLFAIKMWIKDFCDGKNTSRAPEDKRGEGYERWLFRKDWQAPGWLDAWAMKYFGKNPWPWDSLTEESAIMKLTIEDTEEVLHSIANRFWLQVENTVEKAARSSAVSHASEPGPYPAVSENQTPKQRPPISSDSRPSEVPAVELELSKGVREGKIVDELFTHLKAVRNLYRTKGWTARQIRKSRGEEMALLWEWVERINDAGEEKAFLNVSNWDDGRNFIFRQIATLYKHAPHLRSSPGWGTVRDWRNAYRGHLRYKTPDGRKPKP